MNERALRICIAYDRLYPLSVGGAERWYRLLAERLAAGGHDVTYFTTKHWLENDRPSIPGVQIISCGSPDEIFDRGRRRITPILRYSLSLGLHLLRRGDDYDVVHSSSMLGWAALACVAAARLRRFRLVLDWWEVWRLRYWVDYVGLVPGMIGWLQQWAIALAPHQPVAHSALHAHRLRHLRRRGQILVVRGLLPARATTEAPHVAEPFVVYVGRHIPEKQVPAIVPAFVEARRQLPRLRAVLFGSGPDTETVRRAVRASKLDADIDLPGFIAEDRLLNTLRRALCLILLSRREGYGLVVAEASALGVPSIVLRHEDSAATELVADGVNGFICASVNPSEVASAILRVHEAGYNMRERTLAWTRSHVDELSIEHSLPCLVAIYRGHTADNGLA